MAARASSGVTLRTSRQTIAAISSSKSSRSVSGGIATSSYGPVTACGAMNRKTGASYHSAGGPGLPWPRSMPSTCASKVRKSRIATG